MLCSHDGHPCRAAGTLDLSFTMPQEQEIDLMEQRDLLPDADVLQSRPSVGRQSASYHKMLIPVEVIFS